MQKDLGKRRGYMPDALKLTLPSRRLLSCPPVIKTFILMKLLVLLSAFSIAYAHGRGYGQTITLSLKNVKLETAISSIEKQSGYHFIYVKEELDKGKPVTMEVKQAALSAVLELCFAEQPLSYRIEERYVIVRPREEPAIDNGQLAISNRQMDSLITIRGRIVNEKGEAVAGATVSIKEQPLAVSSDAKGEFELGQVAPDATLVISGAEIERQEIKIKGRRYFTITLQTKVNDLDQVLVMAYGQTTKRLNTGNISKVTAQEIERQPVSNPLAAMQGRVAGMTITATSGIPGAAYKILIRGQHSILNGTDPLFIIDGIPYVPGNRQLNQITTAASLSPLQLIDPMQVESIEVLKDAEATAIYGSRGGNGVVMITTRKGREGKTNVKAQVQHAISKVTRTMRMLNLKEYLAMRREALSNDGVTPDQYNAPDLTVWDTTRYTDLKKLLIGGTAHTNTAQVSVSGGNEHTNFLLGAGYNRETTVFPTDLGNERMNVHLNIGHRSANDKLHIAVTTSYSNNENRLTNFDMTSGINYAPNIKLYDSTGKINWQEKGVSFNSVGAQNPLANLNTIYKGEFQNLLSNVQLRYSLLPNLELKMNAGYNQVQTEEIRKNPSNSFDPFGPVSLPYSLFVNGTQKGWIAEPQAEFKTDVGKGKLTVMVGVTAQENEYSSITTNAEDYQSDLLLGSIAGASKIRTQNSYSQYRYQALFGRIQYNRKEKMLLSFSGRKDGSSRFGPANRYSEFGAVSGGWIWSKEKWMERLKNVIRFGKLRASYGSTGNDNIGDYQFLDTWTTVAATYQNIPVLNPTSLFNPNLGWETTKKFEAGIELGLLKDRIYASASYFKNSSGNQLVPYALPAQTGFTSVNKNFEAEIENKGWEIIVNSTNVSSSTWKWRTSFNISFIKNKLVSFPGLANSSYAYVYAVGKPVSARRNFEYTGVDVNTGIYTFKDVDRNGSLDLADMIKYNTTDPKYFGGISNNIRYKNIELEVFFEFKKQDGLNYLNNIGYYPPGYNVKNQPSIVLDRWQKTGDITTIGKYTGLYGTPAYLYTVFFLPSSDAVYSDASFIRCKNVALIYNMPNQWLNKLKISSSRIYVQAQNLFTITDYIGADPENQNLYNLPPLRTIAAGIQISF